MNGARLLLCSKLPTYPVFSSYNSWMENRDLLVFRNKSQLDLYQNTNIDRLLKFYNIDEISSCKILREHPCFCGNSESSVDLHTSGTLSNHKRLYHYPAAYYETIELHHWWRIESEYNLTAPGIVGSFFYNPNIACDGKRLYLQNPHTSDIDLDRPLRDVKKHLFGPMVKMSIGKHNEYYQWQYTRHSTSADWAIGLELVKNLGPKLLLMTPAQIQCAWHASKGSIKFDCPVVVTGEVLDQSTRSLAEMMFDFAIDKMRCWDGGLGFYQCKQGRKHIYDELSYVEDIEGQLVSTDFFNFCHPFIRYANGDAGKFSEGMCDCGVYGRYFEEFYGRETECLFLGDKLIPGNAIAQELNNFLFFKKFHSIILQKSFDKKHGTDNPLKNYEINWAIRQSNIGDLCFYYDCEGMTDQAQFYLEDAVRHILLRHVDGVSVNESDKMCAHTTPLQFVKRKMDRSVKNISIKSEFRISN